jgi:hypothetical protein
MTLKKFISYKIHWVQPYTLWNKMLEQDLEFKVSLSKFKEALKVIEKVKKS